MRKLIGVLALAAAPALAVAAEKPDWAFPVTEKVQPPPRFEAGRVRPVPPGSTLSITRAKADDKLEDFELGFVDGKREMNHNEDRDPLP
jgi:hypothetical protein